MDMYIARQPIFNTRVKVVAYELLYRSSLENFSTITDGDAATLTVVNNTALSMDLQTLTDGKKAFINFTKKLIVDEIPTIFSKDTIVIELLEDIIPDAPFMKACRSLKEKGYLLALDDFVVANAAVSHELLDIVDIIKVDFMLSSHAEQRDIVNRFSNGRVLFLAEKVETSEDFDRAVACGYSYFQGYFFAKPVVVQAKDIKTFQGHYALVLTEITKDEPDYHKLTEIIETDVALTYKLLRLINSPAFYSTTRIKSINHALVRLGQKEIRKWVAILMLRDMSKDKPDEIIRQSLIRAKMAESIGVSMGLAAKKHELFLVGVFSMIDVIMDRPIIEVLNELPLSDEIKDALLGVDNWLFSVLRLIYLYEKADWETFDYVCVRMKIKGSQISDEYYAAVQWASKLFDTQDSSF